jgi:hypothetical protein
MRITITRDDKQQVEVDAHYDPRDPNRPAGTLEHIKQGGDDYTYFLQADGRGTWYKNFVKQGKCSWALSLPRW